jgi:SAM-dependent methyltransferase
MTNKVFEQNYTDQYDLLYSDKDYEAECDLIESAFDKFTSSPVKTILDMGCGTGNHALPLSKRGYRVHGVDLSQHMLAYAEKKAKTLKLQNTCVLPVFIQGDLRNIDLGQKFDSVLMMFAVLGYQTSNADVLAALRTARSHLNPGGLFICDVWYGPAVLTIRPSERVKVIPVENGKVIRAASGTLDTFHHLCEVRYNLWHLSGDRVINESEESHMMRYFFPQELRMLLDLSGFELLKITKFGSLDTIADEGSWNVLVISRAI